MQRYQAANCQQKKAMRKLRAIFACFMILLVFSCTKKGADENSLYGTWVKGPNTGDTLRFYQKNGKNLLVYNLSFNPAFSSPIAREYILENNKLSLQHLGGLYGFAPINSFRWTRSKTEFEVEGIELFPFMASMGTYFTYRKIQ